MTITISNQITLRPYRITDIPDMVEGLNSRKIYDSTLKIPFPYKKADAERFLKMVFEQEELHQICHNWAIVKDRKQVIGSIGLQLKYGLEAHKDEIGYWLAEPFWGQGIMTQVVRIFCDYCFENRELSRIEAIVFAQNVASTRVLEKAGFDFEGRLRKYLIKNGRYIDGLLYANVL